MRSSKTPPPVAATSNDLRWSRTMEIVARAHGATCPAMVAAALSPECENVPEAIAALRVHQPQWFEQAPDTSTTVRALAMAAAEGSGNPVSIRVHSDPSSRCSLT